jgi:hypothetical protein
LLTTGQLGPSPLSKKDPGLLSKKGPRETEASLKEEAKLPVHSNARCRSTFRLVAQPTTRLENKSMTIARYSQP